MSWRGTQGGIAAARAGHDVVMAPTSHTYLDYYQSKDQAGEPLAIGGFLPLETVYAFEPIPAGARAAVRQARARRAGAAVDGVHAERQAGRVHGLPAADGARRSRVDAAAEGLRRLPGALSAHLERLAILDVNYRSNRR